jgi:hypothetical protein
MEFGNSYVISIHQATGPEKVSARQLKGTSHQIATALTLLFQAALDQGKTLDDWKSANIKLFFKTEDRSTPANYRPVSLTDVCVQQSHETNSPQSDH